jgi:hypothetical protein
MSLPETIETEVANPNYVASLSSTLGFKGLAILKSMGVTAHQTWGLHSAGLFICIGWLLGFNLGSQAGSIVSQQ